MRCYVEETGLICKNKEDAIKESKRFLYQNPEIEYTTVCYHPDTKKSIRSVGKNNYGAIWFIVGKKNTNNIINFIKA